MPNGGNFFPKFILLFPMQAFIARIIYFRENSIVLF